MAFQLMSLHRPSSYLDPSSMRVYRLGNLNRPGICAEAVQVSDTEVRKRVPTYQPASWTYNFLQSLKPCDKDEMQVNRADVLEEEIRAAIIDENAEPLTVLQLIDDVQRLGLGYRFEEDIQGALCRYSMCSEYIGNKDGTSLFTTSLAFRLLRQHGFGISSDVFEFFMDKGGKFLDCLASDIEGLLGLYEASHMAFEGELIMEEARRFATKHLQHFNLGKSKTGLHDQVTYSLELPLHRRIQWQEARWYIEAYTSRKDRNNTLLELAVLNFNAVQQILQQDLQSMSRWWNDKGLAKELPFARDRLMECFFWTVGMAFEPCFSDSRRGLTKVGSLITIIDDVYDVYGTLDELELFTDAVERWDVNTAENLPHCMKLCFLALYNAVNEMAYDTLKVHGQNIIPYLTKSWADLCKAFLQEAKWTHHKITPTFDEYLENGWVSASGVVILVQAYFLSSPNITKQELASLEKYHDLLIWASTIFRLLNDLATSSAELERGETATAILCYMMETGSSEELARKHINELIGLAWNKMNKYRASDSTFRKSFIQMAFNLARMSHCTYQHGDSYGAPDSRSKNRLQSLIVEPISTRAFSDNARPESLE